MKKVSQILACLLVFCLPLDLMAAANSSAAKALRQQKLEKMLKDSFSIGGSPLENTYYACLLNGLEQGLSLDQIREDCAIEAIDLSSKGFGDTQLPGAPSTYPHAPDPKDFDPYTVTAACHSGDPLVAGGAAPKEKPTGYKGSDAVRDSNKVPPEKKAKDGQIKIGNSTLEGYGYGSYGGKGEKDPETGAAYKGLSKEESMDQKAEAIMKAVEALEKYMKAQQDAIKETDLSKKIDLINEATRLKEAWEKARDKALEDPNLSTNTSMTANDITPCAEALQTAREFLYECHRTDWKYPGCASMQAATNHCPDPTQVYIDPEVGYACVPAIDTEALKDAMVAECEQLVQFGPDGDNPCHPPRFDGKRPFAPEDTAGNFCESSPLTYIEPGSSSCIKVVEIKPFGEPDIQKLYVWALNKFGGPVVVIPDRDPKPPVGPGPGGDPAP
jgi:hypothetical protein